MIYNSVFIRIPCESVPFHYMDHAEIRARAQKRRLERMGVVFTSIAAYPKCGNTYYEA